MLNEVVIKTAQFVEIVELLLQSGAGLEVTDSQGNTPLLLAVMYYPSTQQTVDMLLEKGADVSAMNMEGASPITLADDKDLKLVLKDLKKLKGKKKCSEAVATGYSSSPDMRRKVFDRRLVEERNTQSIKVRYNSPVVVNSPGLLKRKRKREEMDESFSGRKKRIKFSEQDSTGADIDPQFSEEERENEIGKQDDDINESMLTKVEEIDIEKDVNFDIIEQPSEVPECLAIGENNTISEPSSVDLNAAESISCSGNSKLSSALARASPVSCKTSSTATTKTVGAVISSPGNTATKTKQTSILKFFSLN